MLPAAPYPPYYCPPNVLAPVHCPYRSSPRRLEPGAGPDQQGGMFYGGGDPAAEPWSAYQKTREGWYVRLAGFEPKHLARKVTLSGESIEGIDARHRWLVPQLCKWHSGKALVSALPDVFRNYEWKPPAQYERIIEMLRAVLLLDDIEQRMVIDDDQARDLAIEILAINYHVSIHEMTLGGWLSRPMVLRIFYAAAGVLDLERTIAELEEKLPGIEGLARAR